MPGLTTVLLVAELQVSEIRLRRCFWPASLMINLMIVSLLMLVQSVGIRGVLLGEEVDLVLVNGKVVTMDERLPVAEAIAVGRGKIVHVGTSASALALKEDSTKIIDLKGKLVVPGFIESHAHLTGIGKMLSSLDLTTAKSWDEIVGMVEEAASNSKKGEWILGRGWHQSLWEKLPVPNFDGYPIHDRLSEVSPDNPVLLIHRSGHMCFANANAMIAAGVSRSTIPPKGGEIPRNEKGEALGVFRETAQGLVSGALAKSRERLTLADLNREFNQYVSLAQRECLQYGITTFCDAGMSPIDVRRLKLLVDRGQMDMRMWIMLRGSNVGLKRDISTLKSIRNYGGHRLHVGGIKQMVDGALGAHGAWLLKPYQDLPASTGLVVTPLETIRQTAQIAFDQNLQLCVHAIGDRANREMLDLFEEFYSKSGDRDLRWRIEHSQHIDPDDIGRFGKLGVIASMQGIHCTSDGPFVRSRLGETRSEEGAYVWQSLLSSDAVIANGSDAPVEPVNPLLGFHASVTRRMNNGKVFFGQQKMSRMQALRSYTLDAAFALFQESNRGSISAGKYADLVVLSEDIMTIAEDRIAKAVVTHTFVEGELVHQLKK